MPNRFSISAATVVMLVLLRLNVGWHFFGEGLKHWADPNWTSAPALRAATGPLAPWYHAYLPSFHGFEEHLHADSTQTPPDAVRAWIDGIGAQWDVDRQRFIERHGLNDKQQSQAKGVLGAYQRQLRRWASENKDALETHVHEWRRKELAQDSPAGAEVPYERARVARKRAVLLSEAAGFRAELEELERDYDNGLASLLDDQQRAPGPVPKRGTSIDLVDGVMTYFILAVGALLLVGLFTRITCLAGAAFLFSVVMMQPFWASDALPTYNQYVEMFALLTLATTAVGRWAGLDFFVHKLLAGSNRKTKGQSDASES